MYGLFVAIIFILIYMAIALEKLPFTKIDRASGALIGVTFLAILKVIKLEDSYRLVDWNVIIFLLAMMVMTAYLELSGFFPLVASFIIRKAKNGRKFLAFIIGISALMSSLFFNDTVCILLTPVVLAATFHIKVNPIPYLLAVAFSSNIGSAFTVTGNPQNMYVGVASDIPFLTFTLYSLIPVLISLYITYKVIFILYRTELGSFPSLEALDLHYKYNKILGRKVLFALILTLTLFLFKIDYPLAALIGASFVILSSRMSPKVAFAKIDWQLLLFFAGLFIVMGALAETKHAETFVDNLKIDSKNPITVLGLGVSTLVISNIVSNLPAVLMVFPVIANSQLPDIITVYVAQISTFAGNLTLFGSVANLIVVEKASIEGVKLGFMTHFKAGIIITILTSIVSSAYVLIFLRIFIH